MRLGISGTEKQEDRGGMMHYTIPLPPVTKKNSQRIVKAGNRLMILPSQKYKEYEGACGIYLRTTQEPISAPINIKAIFYMPTRRKVDLSNLIEALNDILVHYGIIADDNSGVIVGLDGSRVRYDKDNPRTEVYIEEVDNEF